MSKENNGAHVTESALAVSGTQNGYALAHRRHHMRAGALLALLAITPFGVVLSTIFFSVSDIAFFSTTDKAVSQPTPTPTTPPHVDHAGHTTDIPWSTIDIVITAILALAVVGVSGYALAKRQIKARRLRAYVAGQWADIQNQHDQIITRWNEPDRDLAVLLSMPAIRDVSVPETAAAIEALVRADELRMPRPPHGCTNAKTTDYARAVRAAQTAVTDAIDTAHHHAESTMPQRERDSLDLAQHLLATARNDVATPHERQLAYDRVRTILKELRLPQSATRALNKESQKLLEA